MGRRKKESEALAKVVYWIILALVLLIKGVFKMFEDFFKTTKEIQHNSQGKEVLKTNDIIDGAFVVNKSSNSDNELEKAMKLHELNEQEKSEARKGNYEVFNFEEENTEEDDYYHEDML